QPALFTRTSMRPYLSFASATMASTAVRSEMSTVTPMESLPSSAAVALAASPLRSATTTVAPSAARRGAMPLPIPCAAPVTMQMRPLSEFMGEESFSVGEVCAWRRIGLGCEFAAEVLAGDDQLHDLCGAITDLQTEDIAHALLDGTVLEVTELAVGQQARLDHV